MLGVHNRIMTGLQRGAPAWAPTYIMYGYPAAVSDTGALASNTDYYSPNMGLTEGSIRTYDGAVAAVVEVYSGKYRLTGNTGTPTAVSAAWYSAAAFGTEMGCVGYISEPSHTTAGIMYFGFHPTTFERRPQSGLGIIASTHRLGVINAASQFCPLSATEDLLSNSDTVKYAVVLGGWNSSGQAWTSGTKTGFTYGAHNFVKYSLTSNRWEYLGATVVASLATATINWAVGGTEVMSVDKYLVTNTIPTSSLGYIFTPTNADSRASGSGVYDFIHDSEFSATWQVALPSTDCSVFFNCDVDSSGIANVNGYELRRAPTNTVALYKYTNGTPTLIAGPTATAAITFRFLITSKRSVIYVSSAEVSYANTQYAHVSRDYTGTKGWYNVGTTSLFRFYSFPVQKQQYDDVLSSME